MLDDTQNSPSAGQSSSAEKSLQSGFTPLTFDPSPYLYHLAESDLTDEQKQALLTELWSLIIAFVDMGFGISPIQQAMDKFPKKKTGLASGFSDVVKSKNNRKINRKRKLRPARELGVKG